ncbi:MAG: hypothetical protein HYV19_08040 [Gemmatimonadetes bacterium]|nr:hypothetical protein [Gemmatimonadota bacterium]
MPTFTRRGEHPVTADAFDLAARLATESGQGLRDFLASGDSSSLLERTVRQSGSAVRLHGRRVEEMFGYVVAVLGRAEAIKREDGGALIVREGANVTVPDYRIVLRDHAEILVEVKNCHHASPKRPMRLRRTYLDGLLAYGQLFARPVYVAVYWSRWRTWSLHPVEDLLLACEQRIDLSMLTAFPASHMHVLGDVWLGTVYPLRFRLRVDAEQLGDGTERSDYKVTIREVQMSAAGVELLNDVEKNIAWSFMQYGQWHEEGPTPVFDGKALTAIDFVYTPEKADDSQDFAVLAAASVLAAGQFNAITTRDGVVTRLHTSSIHEPQYPRGGTQYVSETLPIWRLAMTPTPIQQWE